MNDIYHWSSLDFDFVTQSRVVRKGGNNLTYVAFLFMSIHYSIYKLIEVGHQNIPIPFVS